MLYSSVQLLSRVWLFVTPWITAPQASLSITNSWSSPKLMSIESVMPSSHLILCHPLLLLPPIPPSIRVSFNESTLRMRWPKYWSFSFSINPSNEHPGLISFRMNWLDLLEVQGILPIFIKYYTLHTFNVMYITESISLDPKLWIASYFYFLTSLINPLIIILKRNSVLYSQYQGQLLYCTWNKTISIYWNSISI